jgi:hypothetical protein
MTSVDPAQVHHPSVLAIAERLDTFGGHNLRGARLLAHP